MRNTSLRGLRTFCAAARVNSFKLAAEQLYVTPSAVSHQIRALEQQLGFALFERHARSMALTEQGTQLFEAIEPLIGKIERAVDRIAGPPEKARITLRVPPFFSSELLIPTLPEFTAANPHIDILIDSDSNLPKQHRSGIDASVLILDSPPSDQHVEKLFALELLPACAPTHECANAGTDPATLWRSTLIIHRPRRHAWKAWFRQCGYANVEPQKIIELDTMFAVVRAAEKGLGVALVPRQLSASWFASGSLVQVSQQPFIPGECYYLVVRPEDRERTPVRLVSDWISRQFS